MSTQAASHNKNVSRAYKPDKGVRAQDQGNKQERGNFKKSFISNHQREIQGDNSK